MPLPAIARSSDPYSSHRAGGELTESGARQSQTEAIVAYVRSHPGQTAGEIARGLGPGWDNVRVCRRWPDVAQHHIVKGAVRTCSVSGRKAETWLSEAAQGVLL